MSSATRGRRSRKGACGFRTRIVVVFAIAAAVVAMHAVSGPHGDFLGASMASAQDRKSQFPEPVDVTLKTRGEPDGSSVELTATYYRSNAGPNAPVARRPAAPAASRKRRSNAAECFTVASRASYCGVVGEPANTLLPSASVMRAALAVLDPSFAR